jgi:hypothetical protein
MIGIWYDIDHRAMVHLFVRPDAVFAVPTTRLDHSGQP